MRWLVVFEMRLTYLKAFKKKRKKKEKDNVSDWFFYPKKTLNWT